MNDTPRTVLYILSSNYSGSTLLALMLGAHSRMLQIGESKHLRRRDKDVSPCHICADPDTCPVSTGIGHDNIKDMYRIVGARFEHASVIIDNSKKPWWAESFIDNNPEFRFRFIHLLRDPRALVRRWNPGQEGMARLLRQRWRIFRRLGEDRSRALFCGRTRLYAYKWLAQNREITAFLRRHQADYVMLTYEELAQDPEGVLSKITQWLDLEFERRQLTFWEVPQHASGKSSYVAEQRAIKHDLRWQQDLSEDVCRMITSDPLICNYIDKLGLSFGKNGLERKS